MPAMLCTPNKPCSPLHNVLWLVQNVNTVMLLCICASNYLNICASVWSGRFHVLSYNKATWAIYMSIHIVWYVLRIWSDKWHLRPLPRLFTLQRFIASRLYVTVLVKHMVNADVSFCRRDDIYILHCMQWFQLRCCPPPFVVFCLLQIKPLFIIMHVCVTCRSPGPSSLVYWVRHRCVTFLFGMTQKMVWTLGSKSIFSSVSQLLAST